MLYISLINRWWPLTAYIVIIHGLITDISKLFSIFSTFILIDTKSCILFLIFEIWGYVIFHNDFLLKTLAKQIVQLFTFFRFWLVVRCIFVILDIYTKIISSILVWIELLALIIWWLHSSWQPNSWILFLLQLKNSVVFILVILILFNWHKVQRCLFIKYWTSYLVTIVFWL